MKTVSLFITCCFLVFCVQLVYGQQVTYTLQQCIDSALKNNIQLKQTILLKQSAGVNYNQAKQNLLPNINGNVDYGYNTGRNVDPITNTFTNNQLSSSNASLSANLVLFNGLRLQNFINRDKLSLEASSFDLLQEKENLMLNVLLAYVQVLNTEDVLQISKTQFKVTQNQVERVAILVKEGAVGLYQLTDIKGQLANEKVNIINLESNLTQAKLILCQLMNSRYNADIQLKREENLQQVMPYNATAKQVIEDAVNNMPVFKANNFRTLSAEKNINLIKGDLYPVISLNGSMGSSYSSLFRLANLNGFSEITTGDYVKNGNVRSPVYQEIQNFSFRNVNYTTQLRNNLGYFAGINMQIPLFNNFRVRNRVKLANFDLLNVKLSGENAGNQIIQNIEQAWVNMDVAFNKYQVLQEQLLNFEESFRSAEIRFNTGAINATEFLISKSNLDRTKINLAQAGYEYIIRKKVLDYYRESGL